MGRTIRKIALWILGTLVALLLLTYILIRLPAVQNYARAHAVSFLEQKIGTPVKVDALRVVFPKTILLRGIYFEDQHGDTLFAGEQISADIGLFKLLRNQLEINTIAFSGITAHVTRTPDSLFNFDYIIDSLSNQSAVSDPSGGEPMSIFLRSITLDRVKIDYQDALTALSVRADIGHFETRFRAFDVYNQIYHVSDIVLRDASANVVEGIRPGQVDAASSDRGIPVDIQFRNADLEAIRFQYKSLAEAVEADIQLGRLLVESNQLDIGNQHVDLKSVDLRESDIAVTISARDTTQASVKASSDVSSEGWNVIIGALKLSDNSIAYTDLNKNEVAQGVDFSRLRLDRIQMDAARLSYTPDTYAGVINSASLVEGSGFALGKLQGAFSLAPLEAFARGMHIETGASRLEGDLLVRYATLDSLLVMSRDVYQKTSIQNSHVAMSDVLFWAPDLRENDLIKGIADEIVTLDGSIEGTLDDLTLGKLNVAGLHDTKLQASGTVKGLPDVNAATFDLLIDHLDISRTDLYNFLPDSTIPSSITLPEEIHLDGRFVGSLRAFTANLNFNTSDGNGKLIGDLVLDEPMYFKGNLDLDQYDIGRLMQQDSVLGTLTLALQGDLRDMTSDSIAGTFSGTVEEMVLAGYQYRNLRFDGTANAGMVQANVKSDDTNLKFDFSGTADLTGTSPALDFTLDLGRVDFRALRLMDQNIVVEAYATGAFESIDPDSLNGLMILRNLTVSDSTNKVNIDSLRLNATATHEGNAIEISTDFLHASATGKFELSSLLPALMRSVNTYFGHHSDSVHTSDIGQQLDLIAEIHYSPVFSQLDTNLRGFAPITLAGHYESSGHVFALEGQSARILYGPAVIKNVAVDVLTNQRALQYKFSWDSADFDNLMLHRAVVTGDVKESLVNTELVLMDADEKDRFVIRAQMQPLDSVFTISLNPDKLILNYDDWNVAANNKITIASDGLEVQDFELVRGDQKMSVRSLTPGVDNALTLEFNRFQIETITEIFSRDSLLAGGVIDGTAVARDLYGSPVFTADLDIADFNYRGDTIGNIQLAIDNETPATLSASMQVEGGGNRVDVNGRYFIETEQVDLAMRIDRLLLESVQAFSMGQISQAGGSVMGDLKITGSLSNPVVDGDLRFDSATVLIAELKGVYELENEGVRFKSSDIHFDNFTITDAEDNDLVIDGIIYTNAFKRFGFNLDIRSRNFKVLNTDASDNELYYGTLYLDSRIAVRGDLGNPEINADVTVLDNTNLTVIIPQEAPGIVEREGVVRFVDLDNPQLDSVLAVNLDTLNTFSLKGLVMFANIKVTDDSEFKLVIDQGNGDFLRLKGNAELNASVDPSGKISLTGNYILKEGIYELSFNFLKRRFDIRKGSKITWNGEPTSGELDITAAYVVNAPPIDLVERQLGDATQSELNLYKERLPFELILKLTGILTKPEVAFDIELPEGNYSVAPEVITNVQARLEQISRDEAELNKQAFALVLLNRFLADVPFKNVSGGASAELYARQSVSKLLSQQLNNLAGGLISGVDLNFDIESTEDYSTGQLQNRTDLAVSASKRLLDDRITITVGSNFELEGAAHTNEKSSNVAGDLSVEYQLSRDGRYLLKAYRKNEYEVAVEGQVVKTGLSFVIQMDYNQFKELFQKREKDKN